jgi:hypothetical protein
MVQGCSLCAKLSVHTLRTRPPANAFDLTLKIQSSMLLLQVQEYSISTFLPMHKWLRAECSLLLILQFFNNYSQPMQECIW